MPEPEKDKPLQPPVEREEEEPGVVDHDVDPAFEPPPRPDGQPAWKEKEASKWPIWVALGAIVLVVGWVVATNMKPKPLSEDTGSASGLTTPTLSNAPVNPDTLVLKALYEVRDASSLVDQKGADPAASTAKALPPGTQFVVVSAETDNGVKWYNVQAPGLKDGKGWISARMLAGKTVILVRDVYHP